MLQQLLQHSNVNPASQSLGLNLVTILPARSSTASQQVRAAFEPRVSLGHSIYRESFREPASSYIIKSLQSGSRTIVNYNELPEMTVDEFKGIANSLAEAGSWFHFEVRAQVVLILVESFYPFFFFFFFLLPQY